MINLVPVTLEGRGLRLEPLSSEHHDDLVAAAADGKLWELWFTSVPEPASWSLKLLVSATLMVNEFRVNELPS